MNKEIKVAFKDVQKDMQELHNTLLEADYESKQEVFDRALYLYESVGNFLSTVEDNDPNLLPETANLPDLDEVFADDPVSKYVHAAITYAQSEGSEEAEQALKLAALEVADSQKAALEDGLCAYPDCDCPGISCFGTEEEDCEENCCPECCLCSLEGMDLQDYLDFTEEDYAAQVMANMDLIEQELEGKTEFSQADLYLIRYYLKHQPYNSDYAVEGLSDRALELAWKKIQHVRKFR
jgi:hypothetical protein